MRKITSLLVCAVAILALAAGPAYAQTVETYNGLAGANQGGGGTEAADTSGGSLPFTGLELALVAIAGVGLLGVGYTMRRISSPRESTP
jgi:opacity protein-like surface antigen